MHVQLLQTDAMVSVNVNARRNICKHGTNFEIVMAMLKYNQSMAIPNDTLLINMNFIKIGPVVTHENWLQAYNF